ncbi:glycosyltransferase [Pseudoalteromonas sp. SR41-8]|uniref:glycosyltransferase family 4 protein n=1 Tax=Pseudoalteromonas sp. SR41-8 TaxID=2760946 RepID=UPI00160203C8|nr:glycosyltransferase [Pseudoalteromonas sp. SR41-8]MBB1311779.1 glycosyltransferase [Pseudoalteromonas sp. SR41-8]
MSKKILYLTPAWYGFKEIMSGEQTEITGLPSFSLPIKELIARGYEVDFVIIYTEQKPPKLEPKVSWLKKSSFKAFCYYDLKMPNKLLSLYRYRKVVKNLINSVDYDFVYAHGSSPAVVRGMVNSKGIAFGQRLYGTFLWDKISKHGKYRTFLKHIVEALAFRTEKSFLLVTNDGSRGDLVFDSIGSKGKFSFNYWVNGVERVNEKEIVDEQHEQYGDFIFYCSRIDEWKRQDRALAIIYKLKKAGKFVNLVLAGPVDTMGTSYYESLLQKIKELDIAEQVFFTGSLSKKEMHSFNRAALASLSLYDVCNLTNVFHEMMATGALIIAKNDEVLSNYIVNGENGFLVNCNDSVVEIIVDILDGKRQKYYDSIRHNVQVSSSQLTKSWSTRIDDEVTLIENSILDKRHC